MIITMSGLIRNYPPSLRKTSLGKVDTPRQNFTLTVRRKEPVLFSK